MSFVSLRPNSQCWPRSRTPSLWASPESWGLPVQIAVLLLQPQARLWFLQLRQFPQCLLQRRRPVVRWRPLCCPPRHSGPPLTGRALALAHLCLCRNALHGRHVAAPVLLLVFVALLPSRSRDWSRAWPPRVAHQTRLPSCVSHVSLVPSTLPRQSLSPPLSLLDPPFPPMLPPEAPRATESSSIFDGEWDALLDAHGPTGTAAAVAQPAVAAGASRLARDKRRRRQRKACQALPCGGTSSPLPLPVCPPPGRCVHAGGPALALCTLSWVLSSCRPSRSLLWLWASLVLRDGFGVVPGTAPRSASLRSLWSFTRVARLLWHALPRLVWWPSHLAKRSRLLGLLLLDLTLLLIGAETAGGVMTKLIVRNIPVLGALNSDVHAKLPFLLESSLADVLCCLALAFCVRPVFSAFA